MKGNRLGLMAALLCAGIDNIMSTDFEIRMTSTDGWNDKPTPEPKPIKVIKPKRVTEDDLERIKQAELKRQRKMNKNKS